MYIEIRNKKIVKQKQCMDIVLKKKGTSVT